MVLLSQLYIPTKFSTPLTVEERNNHELHLNVISEKIFNPEYLYDEREKFVYMVWAVKKYLSHSVSVSDSTVKTFDRPLFNFMLANAESTFLEKSGLELIYNCSEFHHQRSYEETLELVESLASNYDATYNIADKALTTLNVFDYSKFLDSCHVERALAFVHRKHASLDGDTHYVATIRKELLGWAAKTCFPNQEESVPDSWLLNFIKDAQWDYEHAGITSTPQLKG